MRLLTIIFSFNVVIILSSCTNAKNSDDSDSEPSDKASIESDTLIYSVPFNYSGTIEASDDSQKVGIDSYKDMLELFQTHNYTPEAWQAGIREIPRIYLTGIGDRWRNTTTKEIDVLLKKQLFFRGLAPLILHSNELIMKDRNRLEKIRAKVSGNESVTEMDRIWIRKLAQLYKVKSNDEQVSESLLDELWKKVDIVPPSLALGQAAEESGWGTSRFAAEGNAIYGQWTWGENAMVPEQQRKELGNYGIASFNSLQESICGYMLNLNTHNAYADLRNRRAELRKKGQKLTGSELAEQLTRYSERGEEYVKGLKSLMEYNRLSPTDDAYLSDTAPIYLVGKAE